MLVELARQYQQPFFPFCPFAPVQNRAVWDELEDGLSKRLITDARSYLNTSFPVLQATDYLAFSRTGNRVLYEEKLFARRTMLNTLVLGECVEHRGNFLDDMINGIYAICEESAWQLPAHNSYIRDTPQLPLPDVTRPVVDLFSAETGANLAVVRYLMNDSLLSVSPMISGMIADELERRIFTPYLTEHFWWMGDGKDHMNNWTVWCTQNVLLAAFLSDLKKDRKLQIFQKACQSIDYFLEEYGEDGCCDEGAQYYRHAGLCLFHCLEILNAVTDGHFRVLYENAKIRNIASYIGNVHVAGEYYINFSDCSPIAGRCNAREFLFGMRTDNSDLMRLAAYDYKHSDDPLLLKEQNLFYRLQTVFHHTEMIAHPIDIPVPEKELYYPSAGLFLTRDEHYFLAVKAGDNDDSHNHNDTGSFILYKNGLPLFIDIGVETYQRKTFSPQRYEIWTMQSQYHNLPTFFDNGIGIMQKNGEQFAAANVVPSFSPASSGISMDISRAYPDERIQAYERHVILKKGNGVYLTDKATCNGLTPVLSLITYEMPVWDEGGMILSIGELGTCLMEGAADVKIELLPITDKRLQTAWKHDVFRTLVTFDGDMVQMEIR